MNLDLDPQWLRDSVNLWRDVVELKIPIHDDHKVRLMSRQADKLQNFIETSKSWKTVLGACTPSSAQDAIEFKALMAEVDEFAAWAKSSLEAIQALGAQEVLVDKIQDIMADPEFGPAIRSLLNSVRKPNPPGGKGQGASEG